jgi:hypothetical protein
MKIMGIFVSVCLSFSALADEGVKEEENRICPGPGGGWEFGCYQYVGEECASKDYCRWDEEKHQCNPFCGLTLSS